MAAWTKCSNFFGKSELNKLFLINSKIFVQSERTTFNALGEKRLVRPKVLRKKPNIKPRPNDRIIWPDADAVKVKGFLRPQKEYIPPEDFKVRLDDVFQRVAGTTERSTSLSNAGLKYNLLDACYEEFNHKVPNSILHKINSLEAVYNFYLQPVDVRTPLEALKTRELPPNLHIIYDYHRFADDPSHFNGVTAYPESNTVVSGLKTKLKYKGFEAPPAKKEYDDELKF